MAIEEGMPLIAANRTPENFSRKPEVRIISAVILVVFMGLSALFFVGPMQDNLSSKAVEDVAMTNNDDDICTLALAFGVTGTMAVNSGCAAVAIGGTAPAICSNGGSNIPDLLKINNVYNVLCGAKKVTTLSFESTSEHPYSIEGSFPSVLPETLSHLTSIRLTNGIGYGGTEKVNILGPLPASISILTKLRTLYLDGDSELNNIPPELCQLSQLTTIVLNSQSVICTPSPTLQPTAPLTQNDKDACEFAAGFGSSSDIYTRMECNPDPASLGSPTIPICSAGSASLPSGLTDGVYNAGCGSLMLRMLSFESSSSHPYSIVGTLPSVIPSSLAHLTSLRLTNQAGYSGTEKVEVQGPIPSSIGILTNLVTLYLSGDSALETNIPTEICDIKSLVTFIINGNSYKCDITVKQV
eukprot:CAMPEP_0182419646 /NCGR_PEP_ID=MMETSP1167-20130531/4053_1 /TAXON_ID=2988 /ORGANISM="Mallomonas Sp, Strain CCMP3275" /LENGTH=411 /DNA_ID=CAMNT_0024594675 /DNA_START=122 /DNA_END=1357 /DNA_ORIENTATION=+